jgi:hypothetical protein
VDMPSAKKRPIRPTDETPPSLFFLPFNSRFTLGPIRLPHE